MKKLVLLVVAILSALIPSRALAIADFDSWGFNDVFAYRHVLETGDQLYLIDYNVNYAALPTENITSAYMVRIRDGATVLKTVAPFAYYTKGYGRGVVAIYFTAADAPAWNGAYTIDLMENPTLTWPGTPKILPISVFTSWSTSTTIAQTVLEITARVQALANTLEQHWTSVDLIEDTVGGARLTTTAGEAYFPNVIADLRTIAPDLFQLSITQPTQPNEKAFTNSYGTSLVGSLIGTPLDFTNLAASWGIPASYISSMLWLLLMGFAAWGMTRITKQFKWATIAMVPMLIFGALLGMLSLVFIMGIGFLCALMIGITFFYNPGNG